MSASPKPTRSDHAWLALTDPESVMQMQEAAFPEFAFEIHCFSPSIALGESQLSLTDGHVTTSDAMGAGVVLQDRHLHPGAWG